MKRKFILGILMVSFTLFACKQEAGIEDIVKNLIGKNFDFCNEIPKEKRTSICKYKIVSYIDSTGCVRCKLRLEEWSRLKADFGDRTCIIFIACPSIIKDLKHFPNTTKNMHPVYVPRQGDIIRLTPYEAAYYKLLLEWETGKTITWDWEKNTVYADGKRMLSHEFSHNYYFMAGDNVIDSNDSRYWGLVPEEYLVGVVSFKL